MKNVINRKKRSTKLNEANLVGNVNKNSQSFQR